MEKNLTTEHIRTRVSVYKSVYWDDSLKYVRNGKRVCHHSWRADIRGITPDGKFRIRKRFPTRWAAERWIEGEAVRWE